jgi:endonuclease YncB( thermonuclease family)
MKPVRVNVEKVIDGDSLIINYGNTSINVRMRFIDTPELKKPWENSEDKRVLQHWQWGINAKLFLTSLIPKDNILYCYKYEKDIYNRDLVDLYTSNVINQKSNLQLNMCDAGMTAYFVPFYYDFTSNRELDLFLKIIRQCAIAKNKKVSFWKDNILLPYQIKSMKF